MDAARPRREEQVLNADPIAQARLLDVQEIDARLDQVAHRRRTLPELAEIERLETRRAELDDQVVVAETESSDLEREQRKADADVEQVRERAARNQQRLDSGQVGSAKDLENLQHELTSLSRRQADLEEVELEIMERLEESQAATARLVAERDELDRELAVLAERRDTTYADLDDEAGRLTAKRTGVVDDVPAPLLTLYEKLRAQHGGVGAAALRHRRCGGCRLELNSVEMGRLRTAPEDEVLRCEECSRILVRMPDSGLPAPA